MELNIYALSSIIIGVVALSKIIAHKTKVVDVLWLILIGAFLGNLAILPEHNEIIEHIGEWGIIFIMFALGFEEDLHKFRKAMKRTWVIAIFGALAPFLTGYLFASYLGSDHNSAMIWGLTMMSTAVGLTMMSLKGEKMEKSKATTGIMTSVMIDDVLSLIGIAILIPIILSSAQSGSDPLNLLQIAIIIGKVILFFIITLVLGLIIFPERNKNPHNIIEKTNQEFYEFHKKTGIKKLLLIGEGRYTPIMLIFLAMSLGATAHGLGFHPAIGAYFAGLFLHKNYFMRPKYPKDEDIFHKSKFVIDHLAFTIFGPIFFVNLGAKITFESHILLEVLPYALLLWILIASIQIISAGIPAKLHGKYENHESIMIGIGMMGRAELAFILINIAYIQNQIISTKEFYILMLTCFLLNITVPLLIKWWKPYYFGAKRLEIAGQNLAREENIYRG